MRRLDRYILRVILGPFLFFALVFTGVIWLSQSLRVIDTIVNAGQSGWVFLEIAALLLPLVFSVVLPVAAFAATLYAVNRLYTDSEIVVMFASGMGGLSLLRPILIFALAVTLLTCGLTVWAMPTAQREMRDRLSEIRGDVATAFLREGTFMNPTGGVTIYIRALGRPGEMLGVFVHDERDASRAVTYTAERAVILREGGSRLVMFDGIAQLMEPDRGAPLSVLRFDQLAYDLTLFEDTGDGRRLKPSELYLPRLLTITGAEAAERGRQLGEYRAEAHEALSAPLYALALPLLAVAFVISMGFRRQGFAGRIVGSVVAAIVLRVLGLAAKGVVVSNPLAFPLLYLPPLAGIALAAWMVFSTGRRGVSRRPRPAEATP